MEKEKLNQVLQDNWDWLYNLSLKMLLNPMDAEDALQEILERVTRAWDTFRGDSKVSTWIYRIAVNHLINRKSRALSLDWQDVEEDMNNYTPYQGELGLSPVEEKIYVEEIKIGCTTAILQCLSPRDRIVFVLGNILEISSELAAEYCNISQVNYRKKLSRGRERVGSFLKENCGQLNPEAKCQCRRRIRHAIDRGRLNPQRLLYKSDDQKILKSHQELNQLDELTKLYGEQPLLKKAFPQERVWQFLQD
ncbi:MAG: RNA polymerase sigma factor [Spirochaetaceae bacterium]|jgi:RNA polymerase sigma factor (sigma-70 family)|nr:RNA polymerase sigma factor [Spirochaetaceae bacterium]